MPLTKFLHGAAIAAALVLAGCDAPDDLSAVHTGDVSNPPAVRGSPIAHLVAACGDGSPTALGATLLRRRPYLQQLGERTVDIVWTAAAADEPTVEVRTPDGALVARARAEVDPTANVAGARQLVAHVEGLGPATTYCYTIREGADAVASPIGFETAPEPGQRAVRFAVWGDSGTGGIRQRALLAQIENVPFDLMLLAGDIAYESGTRDELEERVFGVYAPLLQSRPVWPVAGNHEYATERAAPFREAFRLPDSGSEAGRERWYAFDWGDVHFVALDTERVGEEQAAWLEQDLASNADGGRPWVVALGHKPAYSCGEHGSTHDVRERFGPIFERHRVALVLAGHDHDYERVRSIGGVHYLVTGGGGRETRPVGTCTWTAFSERVIHFVYVTIEGGRLAAHAIDAVGREFDSLVIER